MVRGERESKPSTPPSDSKSSSPPVSSMRVVDDSTKDSDVNSTRDLSVEEPKTLPRIRLRVEEEAGKVKQFATAQGLSMHLKVNKAKRAGLTALHRVAKLLAPKSK